MKRTAKIAGFFCTAGLLAAVVVAALGGRKGDSYRAGLQVRQVSIALDRYMPKHGHRLPPLGDLGKLQTMLMPYLDDAGKELTMPLLARPQTAEPYEFNLKLSEQLRTDFAHPENVILFYESNENYGGRMVAYLDGHHIWAAARLKQ